MKQYLSVLVLSILAFLLIASPVMGQDPEPLPALQLEVPENQQYIEYLGLSGKPGTTFAVTDINADILLIELFSMYCPYCQREAPLVNQLHEQMLATAANGPVVKMIGLGASNSQLEVEQFRDAFAVTFPLFPDKDMSLYNALNGAGTPGFVGVRLKKGEEPMIVLRNSGGFYDAGDFLAELIKSADR